ncbi:MAG: glycine-rich domain-containing protein, partial [Halobacteriaceae archaeon]
MTTSSEVRVHDGYVVHEFKHVGTSTFKEPATSYDVLIVGGGGGGGSNRGGGGGAGGVRLVRGLKPKAPGRWISVNVGAGGAGGPNSTRGMGSNGEDSSFTYEEYNLIAKGGGGGSGETDVPGRDGGSGGGGDHGGSKGGKALDTAYGNAGGLGGGLTFSAGGGGGAGEAGHDVKDYKAGDGGRGLDVSHLFGKSVGEEGHVGGGGGGGGNNGTTEISLGGKGGGGRGTQGNGTGETGMPNTGGGGGGGRYPGGDGGSGIVLVRYKLPSAHVKRMRSGTSGQLRLSSSSKSGSGTVRADARRFRFYKWIIHDTRDPVHVDFPSASGFQLIDGLSGAYIDPAGGEFTSTALTDSTKKEVTFDFEVPHVASGYRWRTSFLSSKGGNGGGDGGTGHDPRRWTLLASSDKEAPLTSGKWVPLHRITDYKATPTRGAWQPDVLFRKERGALDAVTDDDGTPIDPFTTGGKGTGPIVAYGTRRLFGSYVGPMLRVKRALDGREVDVWTDALGRVTYVEGFSQYEGYADEDGGDGGIDLRRTWLKGTTGYAVAWYDQSGYRNDATSIVNTVKKGFSSSLPVLRFSHEGRLLLQASPPPHLTPSSPTQGLVVPYLNVTRNVIQQKENNAGITYLARVALPKTGVDYRHPLQYGSVSHLVKSDGNTYETIGLTEGGGGRISFPSKLPYSSSHARMDTHLYGVRSGRVVDLTRTTEENVIGQMRAYADGSQTFSAPTSTLDVFVEEGVNGRHLRKPVAAYALRRLFVE